MEGVPEPDIQWEKDGVPVTNENFPNVIFAKDSLLLSGVSREDEGTWTCIASNIAGSDSISHQLHIEWAPKVRSDWWIKRRQFKKYFCALFQKFKKAINQKSF